MERFEKKKFFYISKPYEPQSRGVSVDIYKYLDLNGDLPTVAWHFNSIYIEYSA